MIALEDVHFAKQNGLNFITQDEDGTIYGHIYEPKCHRTGFYQGHWMSKSGQVYIRKEETPMNWYLERIEIHDHNLTNHESNHTEQQKIEPVPESKPEPKEPPKPVDTGLDLDMDDLI